MIPWSRSIRKPSFGPMWKIPIQYIEQEKEIDELKAQLHSLRGLLIFRGWATCLALLHSIDQYGFVNASDGYARGRMSVFDWIAGNEP